MKQKQNSALKNKKSVHFTVQLVGCKISQKEKKIDEIIKDQNKNTNKIIGNIYEVKNLIRFKNQTYKN